jgi:hypothetical protein
MHTIFLSRIFVPVYVTVQKLKMYLKKLGDLYKKVAAGN